MVLHGDAAFEDAVLNHVDPAGGGGRAPAVVPPSLQGGVDRLRQGALHGVGVVGRGGWRRPGRVHGAALVGDGRIAG